MIDVTDVTVLVRVLSVITCVTMVVLEHAVIIALETVVARVLVVVGAVLVDAEDAKVTVLAVVLVPPSKKKPKKVFSCQRQENYLDS